MPILTKKWLAAILCAIGCYNGLKFFLGPCSSLSKENFISVNRESCYRRDLNIVSSIFSHGDEMPAELVKRDIHLIYQYPVCWCMCVYRWIMRVRQIAFDETDVMPLDCNPEKYLVAGSGRKFSSVSFHLYRSLPFHIYPSPYGTLCVVPFSYCLYMYVYIYLQVSHTFLSIAPIPRIVLIDLLPHD